ncbi:hypothetical protein RZS08_14825, partial [Arthrospira platensis SPKY1]|nr:hypothetical protein [Arthrospira platensis SPKY1]
MTGKGARPPSDDRRSADPGAFDFQKAAPEFGEGMFLDIQPAAIPALDQEPGRGCGAQSRLVQQPARHRDV